MNTNTTETKQFEKEVGAIWKKTSPTTGKPYLFIKFEYDDGLGEAKTFLLRGRKNDFKKEETHPDLRLSLIEIKDGVVDNRKQPKLPVEQKPTTTKKNKPAPVEKDPDDNLPF